MTHGGKRENAGRPSENIDERRMMVLHNDGISGREIALRFDVKQSVIQRRIAKLKLANKYID